MDGDSNSVCAFRRRMLEMVQETEPPQCEERGRRCLFSMLPPWLVPQSFGKVAVFLADPRYLIMRQLKMWEMFQRRANAGCCADPQPAGYGCKMGDLDEGDFLRAYLGQD